jgi:tetratricopeptide (TPR) repeat protein
MGEPKRGVELNLQLLQDPGHATDRWAIASTANNASACLEAMGKFGEARKYIEKSREAWQSIYHDRAVSLTWSTEANLLRRLGDMDGARDALAKASDITARGYESDRYICAARLALDCADYEEAASMARKAMSVRIGPDRMHEVTVALLAVEAFSAAGHFREAAETSVSLRRLLDELETFSGWRSSDDTRLADEHAARAVHIVFAGQGSDNARLHAAREHLETATGLDPGFGWFHLELAFVDLGQGRQRQATRRLADAARLTDDAALSKGIERMRIELENHPPMGPAHD